MSVGNPQVEYYMPPVAQAISRHMDRGDAYTDIYNRCYEAVDSALSTNDSYKRKIAELEAELANKDAQYHKLEQHCADCLSRASDKIKELEADLELERKSVQVLADWIRDGLGISKRDVINHAKAKAKESR